MRQNSFIVSGAAAALTLLEYSLPERRPVQMATSSYPRRCKTVTPGISTGDAQRCVAGRQQARRHIIDAQRNAAKTDLGGNVIKQDKPHAGATS